MRNNTNNTKVRVREILNTLGVGVLATTNAKGELYASTIYLIADPELVVYFLTKKKQPNIQICSKTRMWH